MITVETEGSRVVVKGALSPEIVKRIGKEFHKPEMRVVHEGWSFQSASAQIAHLRVDIVKKLLHYAGLLRADELFENKQQAQNLWACRP